MSQLQEYVSQLTGKSESVRRRVASTLMGDVVRRMYRFAAVVLMTVAVSACGVSQLTSGIGSGIFGSKKKSADGWQTTVTEESLLAAAKSDTGSGADVGSFSGGCPQMKVWPADRHVTVYEIGRVGDALAVMHRGSITKTARECHVSASSVNVKYGFAGRVLMGPKGQEGTVTLPVKVHVTDGSGTKLKTETVNVRVNLSREKPVAYFSIVRTVGFNVTPGLPADSYRLFVAFDRTIPGAS